MAMNKICAIVKDNFIYAKKQEKLVPDPDIMFSPHAPIMCLTSARGKDIKGGVAYMTYMCCAECMKALGAANIKKVIYKYPREVGERESEDVAQYFDIELIQNDLIAIGEEE